MAILVLIHFENSRKLLCKTLESLDSNCTNAYSFFKLQI